jgi:hypothetical protein
MPTWERLQKRLRLSDEEPSIGISRRGELNLNRAAYERLGSPERVEVLFDRVEKLIGLRAVKRGKDEGYSVYQGGSFWRISAKPLARLFGLGGRPARRYSVVLVGDVLTLDLKEEEAPASAEKAEASG